LVKQVREKINELGVTYIYYQFISVTGRIVGKGIPADHWERTAERGFQLVYGSTANLFVDRHGDYIGYGPESSELVGIPDPETFCQLPWDKRVARVFCTCFRNREESQNPGGHLTSDCRGNLRIIHNEFQEKHGLDMRVGTEPEMMWLKRGEDGNPNGGVTKPNCYHIDQFEELRPTFMKVIEYSQAMGLDIIQGDHEDAPGQLELNTMFDDVLRNADRLTTYRQICAQVAREDGLIACFMSKPFMGVSASGCQNRLWVFLLQVVITTCRSGEVGKSLLMTFTILNFLEWRERLLTFPVVKTLLCRIHRLISESQDQLACSVSVE